MRNKDQGNMGKWGLVILLLCYMVINMQAFPSSIDDFRYIDRDFANPGARQIVSWLASQMRPKEYASSGEIPLLPFRLPLQEKKELGGHQRNYRVRRDSENVPRRTS
ncbi:hypothetical protein NQ318_001611 [Aromia moschata]|uniref:Uncharacterized protein n=1 Tax=Aromia moschata TaxID=1265417 RepID=A0AAV8Y3I0_9CUCU|nr:hypothetical protein NQ318_001611 [Aromia moschata]